MAASPDAAEHHLRPSNGLYEDEDKNDLQMVRFPHLYWFTPG
jgi:hypothetical protein